MNRHSKTFGLYLVFLFSLLPLTLSWAKPLNFLSKPSTDSINISFASLPSALVLVDIDQTIIQRPATPAELKTCIGFGGGDSISIPNELAIEIAPFWLYGGHKITYSDFESPSLGNTFKQTFAVSAAASTKPCPFAPDSSSASLAVGTSFSILRGEVDQITDGYVDNITRLKDDLSTLNKKQGEYEKELREKSEEYPKWEEIRKQASFMSPEWLIADLKIGELDQVFSDKAKERIKNEDSGLRTEINDLSSKIELRRKGFKWDWAAAGALTSPYGGWDDLQWKAGIWTTLGPEWRNFGLLGVGRGLLNDTQLGLDVGIKAFCDVPEFPLACSGEILHHRVLNSSSNLENLFRALLCTELKLKEVGILLVTVGKELGPTSGKTIFSVKLILGDGTQIPLPVPETN